VFGLAWPVLALEAPSKPRISTSQPAFHFTRSQPGIREAYIVSFGLFGGESVFESEAKGAAQILGERLPKAQSLVSFNTKSGGRATPQRLEAVLKRLARQWTLTRMFWSWRLHRTERQTGSP
jgi:hypothetical protein